MQSNLLNSITIILFMLISGCSTSPPDLPPDYGSSRPTHIIDETLFTVKDLAQTCDEVYVENENLEKILLNINKEIKGDRTSDQTLAYLFGAVTFLFDTNSDVEEQRKMIQDRQDTLSLLRRYKKC